ncbi:MAG: PhnD/SsuA/transferrin family substrate-binding protein [Rubripirellula sp.]|nr:PhnD/SsuA/transferrin family substrate-binding protein [Rubripirellula sp.]
MIHCTATAIRVAFVSLSICISAHAEVKVRVGIVAYEDFEQELADYEQFFAGLTEKDRELSFELAVGSYSEVLHWLEVQSIDLAILTPGACASVMTDDPAFATWDYLASVELPPAVSPLAPAVRRASGFHRSYRSVCVTDKDSTLQDAADLRRAYERGEVQFFFVHPKSLSGFIAPLYALRQLGIEVNRDRFEFTYSHTQSLRLLAKTPANGVESVAFVWDDVDADPALFDSLRSVEFAELDELALPRNVVVARRLFEHGDRVRDLIAGAESGQYRFTQLNDWMQPFKRVREWLVDANSLGIGPETLSLDEMVQSLLQYSRSQPNQPRLALVLSGGGAKCSYQVGAVSALEERLAKIRDETGDNDFDIQLVVGTSGGAINAVPVAMGITRSEPGRKGFRDTWLQLDQRDIVRLPRLMRINMGVWFAALQTAIVIWIVRRYVLDLKRRGEAFAIVFTVLAAVEVCLGYFPIQPWAMLGGNHVLHHLWLWLSFGVRSSAWALLIVGVTALLWEQHRSRSGRHIAIPKWLTNSTLAAAIFGLPALQLVTLLFWQETISTGAGMERSLAENYPSLINAHLAERGQEPLRYDADASYAMRLQQVSRDVVRRNLVPRDLVLTGSCLGQTSDELPSDLYFYLPSDKDSNPPPFGTRGVSLREHPDAMLDVVMGSGSIFPLFPGRFIEGMPRTGERIELVDGGFAHNSPVEAAVLWGATHIVLIEAKPRKREERGNFVLNVASAFRHLHSQAQLLDTRSRGRVTIYSVAPKSPHICVLDFADNLVRDSIQRGYAEVANGQETFHRELGEPVFQTVAAPVVQ